jgi:hypothetical protein
MRRMRNSEFDLGQITVVTEFDKASIEGTVVLLGYEDKYLIAKIYRKS